MGIDLLGFTKFMIYLVSSGFKKMLISEQCGVHINREVPERGATTSPSDLIIVSLSSPMSPLFTLKSTIFVNYQNRSVCFFCATLMQLRGEYVFIGHLTGLGRLRMIGKLR